MSTEERAKRQLIEELVDLCRDGERLHSLLSMSCLDTIMVVSPERKIVLCSESVRRMFGYEVHEVLGKKTDMLYFDRRSNPEKGQEIYRVLEREGCHIGLARGRKKSGETLSLEIITGKLRNCGGAVLLLRDITAYKHAEEDLQKQRKGLEAKIRMLEEDFGRRIEERVAELEQAYEEATKRSRMKDDLICSVSHEFKTPLTSIISFTEILLNYPDHPLEEQREFLAIINSESKRLARLIRDAMDFSKLQAGKADWDFREVSVKDVVHKAVKSVGCLLDEKGLKLDIFVEPGLPAICVDEDKILQVLLNLLGNAIKFTPKGGRIRVEARLLKGKRVSDRGSYIHLAVLDNGVGICEEDLPTIFDPYRQCPASQQEKQEGTGLGLSICKEIVHGHHGEIWAESNVGQGSTFSMILPVESANVPCPGAMDELLHTTLTGLDE